MLWLSCEHLQQRRGCLSRTEKLVTMHYSNGNNMKLLIDIFSYFPFWIYLPLYFLVHKSWNGFNRNENVKAIRNIKNKWILVDYLKSNSNYWVPRNKKSTIKNHCKHHQLRLRQKSVCLPRGQHKWLISLNCPGITPKVNLIKFIERDLSYSSCFHI